MKQFKVVAIEITGDKAPYIMHLTYGEIGGFPQSDAEISEMALNYVKELLGRKEVKFVRDISEDCYKKFFLCQTKDYYSSEK